MARGKWWVLSVALVSVGNLAQAEQIVLSTAEEAPYQVYLHGKIAGQAVTQLNCIFRQFELTPVYRITSPARAHLNLKKNRVDGYFSSAPNPDLDRFADMSVPLLVKKWNTYSYDPELLNLPLWDDRIRIGVIHGGNPMAWLASRGVQPTMQAASLEQLLELLHKARVNLILADEMAAEEALQHMPTLPRPRQRFQQFMPLGVYFAKSFLKEKPNFLAHFNRRAESCRAPIPVLSQQQLTAVRNLVSQHLKRWRRDPDLLAVLNAAAASPAPSPDSLRQADARWLAEQSSTTRSMINGLIGSPLSNELRMAVLDQPDLFVELFLSDRYGRLAAASDITSDYFQGDETKFLDSRALPEGDVLIEPIDYDASTRQFSVKVSGPVYGGTPRSFIGVLTFGLRLSHLF
jgi:hypothetical protein